MAPARCGGMMLATLAWCSPKSVTTVMDFASTEASLPPPESGTYSSSPGYSAAQPCSNSFCLEKASLASSTSSFDRGLWVFRYQAIRLARS